MSTKTNHRARLLFAPTIIACLALTLSGCSSKPAIKDQPSELAKLPQWTQIAIIMQEPMSLFGYAAVFWALNGSSLISKTILRTKNEDQKS